MKAVKNGNIRSIDKSQKELFIRLGYIVTDDKAEKKIVKADVKAPKLEDKE